MLPELVNMLSWWQWTILAAVPPAIVALYFLKLKRHPVEVPSTYLWHKTIEDLHVNSIWQRLRRNLLLWLQVLLVLLAMTALLRPGWLGTRITGNRFVFLIDNSASMQATDVTPSRLAEAKRRVGELIDEMSADAAMIVSFSDTARVEQPFTRDKGALRRALAAIEPTQRRTSLAEALKVASGLANPGRSAESTGSQDQQADEALPAKLIILSDGKFDDVAGFSLGNLDPLYVPIVGAEPANVAITTFSVRRNENQADRLQAFARLENSGPKEVTVEVELIHNQESTPLRVDRLTIAAGQGHGVSFDLGNVASGTLHLKATTNDHLRVDDDAWVVINPPQRSQVLLVTPGNKPMELALKTGPAMSWASVRVETPDYLNKPDYQKLAASGAFDLIVFDRCRPATMPASNTFFIAAMPLGSGWSARPSANVPQLIDTDAAHPITQWIDLSTVIVAEGTPLGIPAGGRTLVDADVGPMLAIAPREGFEDLVLGFPLLSERSGAGGRTEGVYGSNWHTRPSFPLFVFNLLHYLGGRRETLSAEVVRPGQAVTIRTGLGQRQLDVLAPSGQPISTPPTRPGEFTFNATNQTGVYNVKRQGDVDETFAVNLFDVKESDIRAKTDQVIRIGYSDVAGKTGWETGRKEIWRGLLLAALGVLLTEWYIYNRRISQ